MRLSKQVIGIAVAVAFAFGLATTGSAFALPNGTQIEYNGHAVNQGLDRDEDQMRAFVVGIALAELFLHTGL